MIINYNMWLPWCLKKLQFKALDYLARNAILIKTLNICPSAKTIIEWLYLSRKKENMVEVANGDQRKVNEKRLFHGTSPSSVEAICKENFDLRLNGKNGTLYGQGSYFAVNASFSHRYVKEDGSKSRFMFLAKVLAGSYTEGESSYRIPPPKQPSNTTSDLYDSCVDNESNPTIFVVFEKSQVYPEYIIQYRSS